MLLSLLGCSGSFVVDDPSDAARDAQSDGGGSDAGSPDGGVVDGSRSDSFVGFDAGPPPPPTCEGLVEASPRLELSCRDPALLEPAERTDRFGEALAFGEEELFVAAPGFREGFASGGVAVYGAEEGEYRLTQWLVRDGLGSALAVRGTRLLVGAAAESIDAEDRRGFLVEYERRECGWVQKDIIDSPDIGPDRAEGRFGASIALHDDFALVGSGRSEGSANLYYSMRFVDGAWTLTDTLSCGAMATQQHKLHAALSEDGRVAALRNDEDALLCIFRRSETEEILWEPAGEISLDTSVNFQGANVAVSEDLVFVGSSSLPFGNMPSRVRAGAVRVFALTPEGPSELSGQIIREPTPTRDHEFGSTVHAECDALSRECALWVVALGGSEDADEAGVLWRIVWHRVDGVRSMERLSSCDVGPLGDIGRAAVFRGERALVSSPVYSRAWLAN